MVDNGVIDATPNPQTGGWPRGGERTPRGTERPYIYIYSVSQNK